MDQEPLSEEGPLAQCVNDTRNVQDACPWLPLTAHFLFAYFEDGLDAAQVRSEDRVRTSVSRTLILMMHVRYYRGQMRGRERLPTAFIGVAVGISRPSIQWRAKCPVWDPTSCLSTRDTTLQGQSRNLLFAREFQGKCWSLH
jgi:hypothetical protein